MVRGVFAGAGSAMFGEKAVVDAVLELIGKEVGKVSVLYLGTATYDLAKFREKQTSAFVSEGVQVRALDVACITPAAEVVNDAIDAADAILVSGGNTLFAVDRWHRADMVEPMRRAMQRGAVLCGGSAGAICWFDGGHSDSMDPEWYRDIMLEGRGAADPEYAVRPPASAQEAKSWQYIRCPGLGFLPGLICPHHDRTQSNGLLRAADFDAMLLRHSGETSICIDHHAALVVKDSGEYSVLGLEGKPGSLCEDGTLEPGKGVPSVWIKRVTDDTDGTAIIEKRPLAPAGKLDDVLRPASAIVEDPRLPTAREENPSTDVVK